MIECGPGYKYGGDRGVIGWKIMEDLHKKQAELDELVLKPRGLKHEDIRNEEVLALQVEMCELVNEVRFFKYWSEKPKYSKGDKVIDEAADVLHFTLSLANFKGVTLLATRSDVQKFKKYRHSKLVTDTLGVFSGFNYWSEDEARYFLSHVLSVVIVLIEECGFTSTDLLSAYDKKYEVNIKRQREGY